MTTMKSLHFAPSSRTQHRRFGPLALGLVLATALLTQTGCSRPEEATASASTNAPASAPPQDAYQHAAEKARGFTAGAMMSANTVYVFFDPQCPHCGHLWQSVQPLLKKVKFVWVPVAIMGPKSMTQGAALLGASNPVETMTAHETSLLAGTGGMSAPSDVPADIEKAIKANTAAFNALKAESVPMIVAKHARSGNTIRHMGALDTAALAKFLGLADN